MISTVSSSFSASWWVGELIISLAAAVGGIIVLWGLIWEEYGEKEAYRDVEDLRSSKLRAKLGRKILMGGIVVEIVVAFSLAALDGFEIKLSRINETNTTADLKNAEHALFTVSNAVFSFSNVVVESIKATQPRRITPEQREKFIKILSDVHNISKIPIRVFVGQTDNETANFALQFIEMLDAAGYGTNAQMPPDEAFKENQVFTADSLPNIQIPPYNPSGKAQEIGKIPNYLIETPTAKDAEVIAVFASTPTFEAPSNTPSVVVLNGTNGLLTSRAGYVMDMRKQSPQFSGTLYAYHATRNTNSIISGIISALEDVGISVQILVDNRLLKPGEVGFFIPERVY